MKPRAAPILPVMSRPRVITVTNQKGGVGKTTTAVSLGAALAERGLRVLLVDCDPQGNATSGLGVRPAELSESIYDVIVLGQPLLEVAIEIREVPGLTLVPSNVSLAGSELELADLPLRESRLRLALDGLEDYDYVLLDTPPSLGLLTVNCLVAADSLLIPLQCEYYALEGLTSLTQTQALVRRSLEPRPSPGRDRSHPVRSSNNPQRAGGERGPASVRRPGIHDGDTALGAPQRSPQPRDPDHPL